jgi:hypothetical protein
MSSSRLEHQIFTSDLNLGHDTIDQCLLPLDIQYLVIKELSYLDYNVRKAQWTPIVNYLRVSRKYTSNHKRQPRAIDCEMADPFV